MPIDRPLLVDSSGKLLVDASGQLADPACCGGGDASCRPEDAPESMSAHVVYSNTVSAHETCGESEVEINGDETFPADLTTGWVGESDPMDCSFTFLDELPVVYECPGGECPYSFIPTSLENVTVSLRKDDLGDWYLTVGIEGIETTVCGRNQVLGGFGSTEELIGASPLGTHHITLTDGVESAEFTVTFT